MHQTDLNGTIAAARRLLRDPVVFGVSMLLAWATSGCDAGTVGQCTHTVCDATAEITTVAAATDGLSDCLNEPMELRFLARSKGPCLDLQGRLSIYGAEYFVNAPNPPRQWVTEENLTVGSTQRAIVHDNGPCPPTVELPDLDFERAQQLCER
jgi:hypothetical protein